METTAFSEILRLVSAREMHADFDSFLDQLLSSLSSSMGVAYAGFWLADPLASNFSCVKKVTNQPHATSTGNVLGQNFKDLYTVLSNSTLLVQNDINHQVWNVPFLSKHLSSGLLSWMCLPLHVMGKLIGFLAVGHTRKYEWDAEDKQVLFMSGALLKQSYFENYYVERSMIPHLSPQNEDEHFRRISDQVSDYVFYSAHNLRHPITNILSLIELVKEQQSEIENREELLDLLKIEAMKLDEVVRIMVAKLDLNEHTI